MCFGMLHTKASFSEQVKVTRRICTVLFVMAPYLLPVYIASLSFSQKLTSFLEHNGFDYLTDRNENRKNGTVAA